MADRDSYPAGTFSYVELTTSDADAAKEFYGSLFGWDFEEMPISDDQVYVMPKLDGKTVGGLFQSEERPTVWASYITVDDVDAAAKKADDLGAKVLADPFDVMEAGRMATIADPQGAVFCLWQAGRSAGSEVVNQPGALTWNELHTTDVAAAGEFYEGLLGWKLTAMEGGIPYSVISNNDRSNGGMMELQQEEIPPHWLAYFGVEDIDAALKQVEELGGKVVLGVTQMGEAGKFAVVADPQGATFNLWSGQYED